MTRSKTFLAITIVFLAAMISGCASAPSVDDKLKTASVDKQVSETVVASKVTQDDPTAESIAEVIDPKDRDRMICQRIKLTGTRFPRRVCMTVAQRDEMARNAQDFLKTGGYSGSGVAVNNGLVDPGSD